MTKEELKEHKGPVWGFTNHYPYPVLLPEWSFHEDPLTVGIRTVRGVFPLLSVFATERAAIWEMLARNNRKIEEIQQHNKCLISKLTYIEEREKEQNHD